jgi:hypothetical protein
MPDSAAPDITGPDGLFGRIRPAAAPAERPWCCVAIDAEEDFDWTRPVQATLYSTDCMRRITDLQDILSAWRIRPSYLWPGCAITSNAGRAMSVSSCTRG